MIIVNARFLTQPLTGVQRYATELSLRLKRMDETMVFVCPKNVIQHEVFESLGARVIGNKTGHVWEQIDLPMFLKKKDLLLNLSNSAPVFHKKKITTLHDISYVLFPQSYTRHYLLYYALLVPLLLKSSLKLITVSEFSKSEISSYFKYPKKNIQVIYNAVGSQFRVTNKSPNPIDDIPYLISVSSMVYHKNHERMLYAFMNICSKVSVNMRLLIVGGTTGCYSKQDYSHRDNPYVFFLGNVKDDELIILYQNATAFIYPSLYEGFGIPPLEAQACGCPVISSNAAAMPEVLGDSALYFDPCSVVEIQRAMECIVVDRELRNLLIRKGFTNVSRFSWDDSARKLYEIIRMKDNVSHDESEQGNDDRGSNPDL
jgi:glycosyltransferase involved in cell wall biosynthesis